MCGMFFLAKNKKLAIHAKLKELSLPDSITRISFDSAKCLSWKASENRTFLLYLDLPLLKPYLPEAFFVHLLKIFYKTGFIRMHLSKCGSYFNWLLAH